MQIDAAFRQYVDPELFTHCAVAVLRHQDVTEPADLSIVLTSDAVIHELNRAYRGIDAPTDVLAFGTEEENSSAFVTPSEAPQYLGDVIISFPRAEAQAQEAGHAVEAELRLLAVHGVLHLLGHDHADADHEALMWAAQSEILQGLAQV